jgi:hypothetical protein
VRTLFLISSGACLLAALAWYFVWAIWIHAKVAAHGPAPANVMNRADPVVQKRLAWYGRLKLLTLILLVIAVSSGTFWYLASRS